MLDQCKFPSGVVILLHPQHEQNINTYRYIHIGFKFYIQKSSASTSLITVERVGLQQASKIKSATCEFSLS